MYAIVRMLDAFVEVCGHARFLVAVFLFGCLVHRLFMLVCWLDFSLDTGSLAEREPIASFFFEREGGDVFWLQALRGA